MSGGFTYKANAEYRSLQEHLVREHRLLTKEVSGKLYAELQRIHAMLEKAR